MKYNSLKFQLFNPFSANFSIYKDDVKGQIYYMVPMCIDQPLHLSRTVDLNPGYPGMT